MWKVEGKYVEGGKGAAKPGVVKNDARTSFFVFLYHCGVRSLSSFLPSAKIH